MGVLELRPNCLLPPLGSRPPSASVGEIMKGLLTYEMGFTGGRLMLKFLDSHATYNLIHF